MGWLQLLNVAVAGGLLWVLTKLLAMSAPLAWRLVLALPLLLPLSGAALMLWDPPAEHDGSDALWVFRPNGIKLNFAHPTARKLLRAWAALGLCWLLALDEAVRHDFSRLLGW